jgi:hypothetical protein
MLNWYKTRTLSRSAFLLLAGILLATCNMEMGLGPSIDLEAPVLTVTAIERPDGQVDKIENGKVIDGPGKDQSGAYIRVGAGFTLIGTAQDNVAVEQIVVDGKETVSGRSHRWTNALISSAPRGGVQNWGIKLDGIGGGEWTITITAYDRPRNIGPETVKELTLLVDTDPPFVDNVKIWRTPGSWQADLLPRTTLGSFDPDLFDYVDNFQNEQFEIHASIDHEFSLSNVWLNLYDDAGSPLFPEPGLERTAGELRTPVWHIDEAMLTAVNPIYASGRHYFKVKITALALAGHSGDNLTNLFYNLCWYPEADIPKISKTDAPETGEIQVEADNALLVNVFDDDNIVEAYAAMVTVAAWNSFMSGSTDAAKLDALTNPSQRTALSTALAANRLTSPMRNTTLSVPAGEKGGSYKMVILVLDQKGNSTPGVWNKRLANVLVTEKGAPTIEIITPAEDRPALTNGEISLSGRVFDIYEVRFLRVLWIPAGLNLTAEQRQTEGERLLRTTSVGAGQSVTVNSGITIGSKIWGLSLGIMPDLPLGGRDLIQRSFNKNFNILTDFTYGGSLENKEKFLMLYTQGQDGFNEAFETLTLMPYEDPPEVKVTSPTFLLEFTPGTRIDFTIEVTSPFGVPITSCILTDKALVAPNNTITLVRTGTQNSWTGNALSHTDRKQYDYLVTARDALGNEGEGAVSIQVTALPTLESITTPHLTGAWFSKGEAITIRANFSHAVLTVNAPSVGATPRIALNVGGTTRYANYTVGAGSKTLEFVYTVETNDWTNPALNPNRLTATQIQTNGGSIGAQGLERKDSDPQINYTIPGAVPNLVNKNLYVDGRAPTITGITFATRDGDSAYPNWIRADATVEARVTVNKAVRVLGTPQLKLLFNGTNNIKRANFLRMDTNNTVMVFEYKIQNMDEAEPVRYNLAECFDPDTAEREVKGITDNVGEGNALVLAATGTIQDSSPRVQVDAVPPAQLTINPTPYSTTTGTPATETYQITGIFETAVPFKIQYTENGFNWLDVTQNNPYRFTITEGKRYQMQARQIDRAGNVSPLSAVVERDLASKSDLNSVICDNPDGAYREGTLNFRLGFSGGPIYYTGTGTDKPSITLAGGTGTEGGEITLYAVNTATALYPTDVLEFSWVVTPNRIMEPVRITAINLNGVKNVDNPNYVVKNLVTPTTPTNYLLNRPALKVMSQAPTITAGYPVTNNDTAVLVPTATQSQLSLTFSHAVWPEKGYIVVRPADGWHIPPVLTNADYTRVLDALSTADQNTLNSYYTQTTHGLAKNAAGQYTGTPDTNTKYVLRFSVGLSNTTAGSDEQTLRAIFERAKYLWQEIEVVSASQVTTGTGTPIPSATGTIIVRVNLDRLADGRQWRVGIEGGAFRDEAGNVFAGWQWGGTDWAWNATDNRFWSQTVAEPVIRVNRISNNHWYLDPRNNTTTPTDVGSPTDPIGNPANAVQTLVPHRTNVQYRIDCETPGAEIQYRSSYGTAISRSQTVDDSTETGGRYGGNPNDGPQNGTNADATAADLNTNANMTPNQSYDAGITLTIGDDSLYTARKDYITASATRVNLSNSARGAEGAFKTVIVYRNPPNDGGTLGTNRFVKTEAVDQRNGAVSIAGFPMNYNDMSGRSSKNAYRVPVGDRQVTGADDWVWISWEMVSTFYHVGMLVTSNIPNTALNNADGTWDAWRGFSGDWYNHNFRKYGNWGLRVAHQTSTGADR